MKTRNYLKFILFSLLLICISCKQNQPVYDLLVYGGTSAGVASAVQAARMNKKVIIIEPGIEQLLGGLTSGGLGRTDYGNKHVIGGIALEFYKNLNTWYLDSLNWKWQSREEYFEGQTYHPGSTNINEDAMWFFEPSAARKVFQDWIDEYGIPVIYGERLLREGENHTKQLNDGRNIAEAGMFIRFPYCIRLYTYGAGVYDPGTIGCNGSMYSHG